MHILETDTALDILRNIALSRFSVDLGSGVEKIDDITSSTLGRGDIGDEGENISGLDGTKGSTLNDGNTIKQKQKVGVGKILTMRAMKKWNVETSNEDTKREPYQKTRAMT